MTTKQEIKTSKAGVAFYPYLTGEGALTFDKSKRVFSIGYILPLAEAQELFQFIKKFYDQHHVKGYTCQSLACFECNEEGYRKKNGSPLTREQLTHMRFNFKTNTHYPDGSKVKIVFQDALACDIDPTKIRIGNGSMVRVAGTIVYYTKSGSDGVILNLKGVQVVKLVEYNPNADFAEYKEEGGYSAENDNPDRFEKYVETPKQAPTTQTYQGNRVSGQTMAKAINNRNHPNSVTNYLDETQNGQPNSQTQPGGLRDKNGIPDFPDDVPNW